MSTQYEYDYYNILNVPFNATQEDIKKAYRTLAKIYHPDCGGNEYDFVKIQKAYDILSDTDKRKQYDEWYINKFNTSNHKDTKILKKQSNSKKENKDNLSIEKLIMLGSQIYYNFLEQNGKGTIEIPLKEIIPLTESFVNIIVKKRISDSDGLIIKFKNIILTNDDYTLSSYDEYIITIKLKNQEYLNDFNNDNIKNIKIEYDLKFLVKRVERFWQNTNNIITRTKNVSILKIHDSEYFECMSESQINAVKNIITNPISYIWGAPGTGKTRMVLAFCVYKYIQNFIDNKDTDSFILIITPTNVALEQTLYGVLEILENNSIDTNCILRMGVASDKFQKMYPHVCENKGEINNLVLLKYVTVLIKLLDKENTLNTLTNSLKSIKDYYNIKQQTENILTEISTEFSKLKITKKIFDDKLYELLKLYKKEFSRNIFAYKRKILNKKQIDKQEYEEKLKKLQHSISKINFEIKNNNKLEKYTKELSTVNNNINETLKIINYAFEKLFPDTLIDIDNKKRLYEMLNILEKNIADTKHTIYSPYPELLGKTYNELLEQKEELTKSLNSDSSGPKAKKHVFAMTLDKFYASEFSTQYISGIKHIFLDEACYANMAKASALFCKNTPITFLGDHKQLAPVCEMNDFNENNKAAFVWSQSSLHCESYFTKTIAEIYNDFTNNNSIAFEVFSKADLTETYRFGNNLANILNTHIYKNGFKSVSKKETKISYINAVKTTSGKKRENLMEALKIKEYLDTYKPTNFVILSPYINQVNLLKKVCETEHVMTIHKSQGKEWDTVILSVSDSVPSWFTDSTKTIGAEVLNTAISRAKKEIVLFCNYNIWINRKNQLITDILKISKEIELTPAQNFRNVNESFATQI